MPKVECPNVSDIVAVMGIDCVSGDTLCDRAISLSLERMHTAEPVISLAIRPVRSADREPMSKALNRFMREDPTFHVRHDDESGDTIISGDEIGGGDNNL